MTDISTAAEALDTLTQIIAHHEMRWSALRSTLIAQTEHYENMASQFPKSDCASIAAQVWRDLASMDYLEGAFPMARKTPRIPEGRYS